MSHEQVIDRPASRRAEIIEVWRRAAPYVLFAIAVTTLSSVVNVRYPGRAAPWAFLLPSLDVVGLLACYAAVGRFGWRVPTLLHGALVGFLLFVRVFRIADGIETRYLYRSFNLWSDAQLIPEFARLLYSTLPIAKFLLAATAATGVLVGVGVATSYALRYCERFLRTPRHAAFFAGGVGVFLVISPLTRPGKYPQHHLGAFASSVLPRLGEEADFILQVHGYRSERLAEIARVQRELSALPTNLDKLRGHDVLLFVIESYGATVFEREFFSTRLGQVYDAFDASLERNGFAVASNLFDSPTYGGGSWLAHATLATGVRVSNQFQYSLLKSASPQTMAGFFKAAGFRTVLVQPATTHNLPTEDFHRFEQCYYAVAFDYTGPSFAYAPMPDQYVIDFIHRQERAHGGPPRFIEYALVSSHLPWTEHAPIVEDWTKIKNGAIYRTLEKVTFPGSWDDFSQGSPGYAHALGYDLEVLRRYVIERVTDDALVIIVGDHQPAAQVTLDSPDQGVPIHVMSRNRAFVEMFVARGYTRGMRPALNGRRLGLEAFLPAFLQDFSEPSVRSGPGRAREP